MQANTKKNQKSYYDNYYKSKRISLENICMRNIDGCLTEIGLLATIMSTWKAKISDSLKYFMKDVIKLIYSNKKD